MICPWMRARGRREFVFRQNDLKSFGFASNEVKIPEKRRDLTAK